MICAKELALSFLPLPWRFCPTAAFPLKPFLRVPMALTGIVGRVRAPMLLAQHATFLDSHLVGDSDLVGSSALALTFVELSGGFLGTFPRGLFLGIGIRYYFFNVLKNAQ
jgi:hypothetical protein